MQKQKFEIPGVTGKFGLGVQNEAGQRLIEFCQENTLVIANTVFQQHKRKLYTWITRWSIPKSDWSYALQPKWRSSIQSVKTRPEADYGSDHEVLIAKFRVKFKKMGKTTRPFRYDLNQIPYDNSVEMMNTFKGLDLVDRVPEELRTSAAAAAKSLQLCSTLCDPTDGSHQTSPSLGFSR